MNDSSNKSASNPPQPAWGSVDWLRNSWIEYFEKQNHLEIPSAGLIPAGDPTLLFTTAGMVQFKSYFSGIEKPPHSRVISIQKCLRTTDLESVGKTSRHCTFFEMLGNFSFGDYFKKEAIAMAWEFSTAILKFKPEQIYISVYLDDDEAEAIWINEIGVPKERIVRLGKEDNWWGPAGDTGPCGPCSELYIDRGPEKCSCSEPEKCAPGVDCERFLEYWNIVFNQFNQDAAGQLHSLDSFGIDTGAGLERIAAIINNEDSVYDTDELSSLIKTLEGLTGELGSRGAISYASEHRDAFRVVADHIRCISFAIADGVFPDNTGRGYVIRRVIRRALLYLRELGINEPLLYRMVENVVQIYGHRYRELSEREEQLKSVIQSEEQRFLKTLEQGLRHWEEYLDEHRQSQAKLFSGQAAFRLYDTFGFPLEMTIELAEKLGFEVDLEEFEKQMEIQRQGAQSAGHWQNFSLPGDLNLTAENATVFSGYEQLSDSASVIAIIKENQNCKKLSEGSAILILDRSCFYPESGGQLGDHGLIQSEAGALFRVNDTRKFGEFQLHSGELLQGEIAAGTAVTMEVDAERRSGLVQHHTATHLLNRALRENLGDHVGQTGSLVAPDYLRFDFSHHQKMSADELERVESQVNAAIDANAMVSAETLPIDEARKLGAVAAFGEKYGAEVRVVSVGEDGKLSREFCGGTHARATGELKYFHILKESSPGAGNRRIEAISGERVKEHYHQLFSQLAVDIDSFNQRVNRLAEKSAAARELQLGASIPDFQQLSSTLAQGAVQISGLNQKVNELRAQLQASEKKLIKSERNLAAAEVERLLESVPAELERAPEFGSVKCVSLLLPALEQKELRRLGDAYKERHRSIVVLLGVRGERGPLLLFMANKNAVEAGVNCGQLISKVAPSIGGGGGGRPDMAQAGGKDSSGLKSALEQAMAELKKILQ